MYATQTETTSTDSPLSFAGACGCTVEDDRIVINIAEIANHRDLSNLSGTLGIELWAFERAYSGGGFTGIPLCGTSIGELAGQRVLTDCRYDLLFQEPPPGTWSLTLMLREWTAGGYVTRDYVNFTPPYVVESIAPVVQDETDTAIAMEFAGKPSAPVMPAEPEATPPRAGATPDAATTQNPPEPSPDTAISLGTASAREPVVVEGVGAKLMRMVGRFIKL
jgi:hypothetical protein